MIGRRTLAVLALVALGSLALAPAADGASKKLNGTWMGLTELTLPGVGTVLLPELGTFDSSGTVVFSAGFPPIPLETDQGNFVGIDKVGHGSWKSRGGQFSGTQYRFVVDANSGMPMGFIKVVSEWQLEGKTELQGTYRAELLQLDLTPYTAGGAPVIFEGGFELARMKVERMP